MEDNKENVDFEENVEVDVDEIAEEATITEEASSEASNDDGDVASESSTEIEEDLAEDSDVMEEEEAEPAEDASEGDVEEPETDSAESEESCEKDETIEEQAADNEDSASDVTDEAEELDVTELSEVDDESGSKELVTSEQPEETEEEKASKAAKKAKRRKVALIACGSVVGVLAVAYAGGAVFFSNHFMPNTTLNGKDVSMKAVSEVASEVDALASSISPTIEGQGLELSFSGDDIKLEVNSSAYAKTALQQEDNLAWPVEVFNSHDLSANFPVTYSKSSLTKIVSAAVDEVNKDGKEPQNAYIGYSKSDKKYVVKQGDLGTLLDESSILSAVDEQLQTLNGTVALTEANLKQPAITVDNEQINNAVNEANGYITSEVTFKNGDNEIYVLGPTIMKDWVTFGDSFEVKFNEDAARTWLDNDLKTKVNSAGSERKYKNENGKKVTVSGGTYGWSFDLEGVTDKAIKKITSKKACTIKLKALTKGAIWNPGGKDWDGKYIDIDLGDQYARLYDENGKVLWESDIVSGNTSAGNGTPTGVYVINDTMARNVTLVSSERDEKGKPTYESPVSYWMPFVGNSVGLHDASWRGEFGGGIYTYNGSHGCVNLPTSTAGALYEQIEPGIVVSCHY